MRKLFSLVLLFCLVLLLPIQPPRVFAQGLRIPGPGGATAAPATTDLVTSFNLINGQASNFDASLGAKFVVGGSTIHVTALGRYTWTGNSLSHTLMLTDSSGAHITGGSCSVNLSGATANQANFCTLSSAVTLSASTTYYLVSSETNGGDEWENSGSDTATWTSAVGNMQYAYTVSAGSDPSTMTDVGGPFGSGLTGAGYGPITFKYY